MTPMTVMTMNYRGSLKGVAALFLEMRDGVMGREYGSTSATKPVAVAVPLGHKEPALLNTPHPLSDYQDLGERQCSTWTRRSPW
jgi:hypothetical protein